MVWEYCDIWNKWWILTGYSEKLSNFGLTDSSFYGMSKFGHFLSLCTGKRNKRAAGDYDPGEEITDDDLQAYPEFRQDNLFTPTNVRVAVIFFSFSK